MKPEKVNPNNSSQVSDTSCSIEISQLLAKGLIRLHKRHVLLSENKSKKVQKRLDVSGDSWIYRTKQLTQGKQKG